MLSSNKLARLLQGHALKKMLYQLTHPPSPRSIYSLVLYLGSSGCVFIWKLSSLNTSGSRGKEDVSLKIKHWDEQL